MATSSMGGAWRENLSRLTLAWREARAAADCQHHLNAFEEQLVAAGLKLPNAKPSVDVQCAIIEAGLRCSFDPDAVRLHCATSIGI